jgi:aspartate dehydrogenase
MSGLYFSFFFSFLLQKAQTLGADKTLFTVSGAALLENPAVMEMAQTKGRLILATGAILGIDAVKACAKGTIFCVNLETRKPPKSLQNSPYLKENGISLFNLQQPLCVFKGTAREGAQAFPANVNVAATLGLAGIGPDETTIEIWADPAVERNTHQIYVDSNVATLRMQIENVCSEENPGTGKITALSLLTAMEDYAGRILIGT